MGIKKKFAQALGKGQLKPRGKREKKKTTAKTHPDKNTTSLRKTNNKRQTQSQPPR